jgi:peptide/nickel transport system ATP-binding protein
VAGGQILLEGQRIDNLPHEQMRHIRGRRSAPSSRTR